MFILYKPLGVTPYEAILDLKKKKPYFSKKKLSYAGRLDPMAEGLLMILEDEENKNRRSFEKVDKVYEFESILGISSDSYDLLGIPRVSEDVSSIKRDKVKKFISEHKGKVVQEYPVFSSAKVHGKPLYWWTRRKKEVKLPKKEIYISEFKILKEYYLTKKEVKKEVYERTGLVKGDFRQDEIAKKWDNLFEKIKSDKEFQVFKFRMKCSSGGYVRSMVNDLGLYLGCGAITLSIIRTKIGEFDLSNTLRP